jgi:hypothetical protein
VSDVDRRRLLISVFYEGPWERLASWLWAVGREDKVVRDGSLRDRLACRADYRDRLWCYRYALRGRDPHPRWKRRTRGASHAEEEPGAGAGAAP